MAKNLQARPSIFVSIASYRDTECQHTIRDLFARATHPERVSVGICWQIDKERDQQCFAVDYHRGEQVREVFYDWREGEGVCWARAKSHELMQQEEYFLQIDSHSRMIQGWDEAFIEMLESLYDPKAVLTGPPARYDLPNELEAEPRPTIQRVDPFHPTGNIRFTGVKLAVDPETPLKGFFISAACIFARSDIIRDVPYDPFMYFEQEEVSWALRLYTHGWNVFSPNKQLIYHLYADKNDKIRHTHWNNLIDAERASQYRGYYNRSLRRFNHLTQYKVTKKSSDLIDFSQHGLGMARSLESFELQTGINFRSKHVSEYGLRAMFIPGVLHYVGSKIYVPSLDDKNEAQAGNSDKTLLADSKKHDKSSNSIESGPLNMPTKATKDTIVICISANHRLALDHLLGSIFQNENARQQVKVAIAWHAEHLMILSDEGKSYQSLIRSRHLMAPPNGNAIAEVLDLWSEPDTIIMMDQFTSLADNWLHTFQTQFKSIPKEAFFTQGGLLKQDFNDAIGVTIAAEPKLIANDIFIIPQAKILEKKPANNTSPCPILSFDFLAGKRALWRELQPDPYLPKPLGAMVFAARCFTYGISIYQAQQPFVMSYDDLQEIAENRSRVDPYIRAKHMLGIEYSDKEMALVELDRYGHGEVVPVEEFWARLGVDYNAYTITAAALAGEWKPAKKKAAAEIISFYEMLAPYEHDASSKDVKIFVQIASYRDEQCQYTVQDLFDKAAYPDRIFVGICWQSIPEEDEECFRIVTRPDQVRVKHFDARESKGACWARFHTQKLWQGEEYTFQIDSHMRFEKGWDVMLLSMMKTIGNEKAVLTTYPAGYTPPNDLNPKAAHKLIAKEFDQNGIFLMGSQKIDPAINQAPVIGAFVSACMLFGPSSIIQDVPYDPYLYFFGEEISLSVRLWTHGYDIYHPHLHVVWHDWKRDNRKTTHFRDHESSGKLNAESFARVRYLLNREEPTHPELQKYVRQELDVYGLGLERTLEAYEAFAGVNFRERRFEQRARDGMFPLERPVRASKSAKPKPAKKQAAQLKQAEPYIAPKTPLIMPKGKRLALPPEQQLRNHGAVKTYESNDVVVYDDFLPEDVYNQLYQYTIETDYRHINTTGNVNRVWSLDNGFPLRSEWNAFYEAMNQHKHDPKQTYPTRLPTDRFIEQINTIAPEVQHIIGAPKIHWAHYSVTGWIYPPNTGLSLHNDGSNAYSGAYVYFLNKEWRIHWGGLLLVLDSEANDAMETHRKQFDGHKFHREKWLHESEHNDYAMETGFARTIFPKRNRMVFIAPDAYHIVTKVLPNAGDNVRMSLAGFFARGILNEQPQQHHQS